MQYLTVGADGTTVRGEMPATGVLQFFYREIGCTAVDIVSLVIPGTEQEVTLWLDDEGMLTSQPLNLGATRIAWSCGARHQPYFGTVVVTGGADDEGETLGLPPGVATILAEVSRNAEIVPVYPLDDGGMIVCS